MKAFMVCGTFSAFTLIYLFAVLMTLHGKGLSGEAAGIIFGVTVAYIFSLAVPLSIWENVKD